MFQSKFERRGTKKKVMDAVDNATTKTTLGIATAVAAQAKLFSPVDLGQLRNSIAATTLKNEQALLNTHGGDLGDPLSTDGLREGEAYVGTASDHAVFMEYGTRFASAQPFLRPAADVAVRGSTLHDLQRKYSDEEMRRRGL